MGKTPIAVNPERIAISRLCAAICLFIAVAGPAAAAPDARSDPGFRVNVVYLGSDPPGETRQAPGGGRILTPAVIYTPAAGANPYGPALVILDRGPGSHPLEQGQASRFAAERLAAQGYTVASVYDGQERGFALTSFADTAYAVRGAIDYLETMGHEKIVLVGQGYGAIVAANYLATQPDTLLDNGGDKRVKAVVLLDPLTELRRYPGLVFPDGYDALVARAKESFASGKGVYPAGRTLDPGHGAGAAYDPWILPGPYIAPAEGFLDYWGPEAAARNARLLGELRLPTLALVGTADDTVSIAKLKAFPGFDVVEYAGGDARFTGLEGRVVTDMAGWLAAHGLAPQQRVTIAAVDVTADDGRILQGVLYTPDGVDVRHRPAVMLVSGRTGDTIQSSSHWMGWRIAQQGYAVIAPGMRISGVAGVQAYTLADTASDLGHWIDRAAQLGYGRVVMGGHSNGGIWLSNYLGLTHDPRVVGTLYFAPTRDEPTFTRKLDGDAVFDAKVAAAQAAVAAGRGTTTPIGLLSAQSFLDFTGPASRAMHTARVKEFALPGLAIVGGKDPLMSADFVDEFTRAYRGPLTLLRYDNGSHGLRESKDRLAVDVGQWLQRTFPGR